MDFTDRLTATDRAVSSYIRFAGDPAPPPSEAAGDMFSDLLHWHERFVVGNPPMSKREVRRMVNEAVKTFYEEREALAQGERPLARARRELSPEMVEARRIMREEQNRVMNMRRSRPTPLTYDPTATVQLPAVDLSHLPPIDRETRRANPDGCDHRGRVVPPVPQRGHRPVALRNL